MIAKELSFIRALHIRARGAVMRYLSISISASTEYAFTGVGVLILVLVLESGIECWHEVPSLSPCIHSASLILSLKR